MAAWMGVAPSPLQALEEKLRNVEQRLGALEERAAEDRVAIVVFSGDLDRVMAAFVIATGAAAMGQQVSMFFTFWGLSVIKKKTELSGKTLFQRTMALMAPGSSLSLPSARPSSGPSWA